MLHNQNLNRDKTEREKFLLKAVLFFCILILTITSVSSFMPLNNEQKIYDDLIRLHVLANSDSDEDQALKYKIRDLMLNYISSLTKDCTNVEEAENIIKDNTEKINKKVQEHIKNEGYNYTSTTTLTRELYPTIEYGDSSSDNTFRLPKGEYTSLRILIGEAEGKNWWCVLFPPLCLSGSKVEDELAVAGYTNEQIQVLKKDSSPKYIIRFKILEVFADIFN